MLYFFLFLIFVFLAAVACYFFFKCRELTANFRQEFEAWEEREEAYTSELTKLDKIRHIPDVIERAKQIKAEAERREADAERRASDLIERARVEAQLRSDELKREAEAKWVESAEALKVAQTQAQNALEEAQKEAKALLSKARKDAKAKQEGAENVLILATNYAADIRQTAEKRALEIAGEAYAVKGKIRDFQAEAMALQNRIKSYEGVYIVPPAHILDELAEEFGFSNAGEKLKLARTRTRLMKNNGTATTCGYPEGWKKDHALKFVLNSFDGAVDSILSRIKAGNQGKLIQEIKDAYALVNKDGEVYKNARICEEYLESRLEELKWGTAVQKLKEKGREEQRAIREQIREEQRAKKEIERAIKQAEREEELVNQAIIKLREQFEQANEAERAVLESKLQELNSKLIEAEEKGRKALSMAQQTKRGHVYIISNAGSFGENVFKIGLTRRLDPTERVRELGDASVPFPFDVHAMFTSEDAPSLENTLHKRFVERQMNKLNRRKEFFRVSIQELKQATEELGIEATWTLAAEASQYKETLALEQAMKSDKDLRKKWLEEQANISFEDQLQESEEEEELEEVEA